jgi:hypothetical protein
VEIGHQEKNMATNKQNKSKNKDENWFKLFVIKQDQKIV